MSAKVSHRLLPTSLCGILLLAFLAGPLSSQTGQPPSDEAPSLLPARERDRLEGALQTLEWMLSAGTFDASELAAANADVGALLLQLGLDGPASVYFGNAQTLEPDNARWAHVAGSLAAAQGDSEAALKQFEQALRSSPDSLATHLQMARIDLTLERWESARLHFEAALEVDPTNAYAHLGIGQVAKAESAWTEAALEFEEALRLQPEALALHRTLAELYRQLGDETMTAQHASLAGPGNVEYLDPVLTVLMSLDLRDSILTRAAEERRKAELETTVAQMESASPPQEDPTALSRSVASAKLGAGDASAAVVELETALAIDPKSVETLLLLGRACEAADLPGRSQEAFQKAVELAPERRDVQLALARSLAKNGRHGLAVPHYEKAVELGPGDLRTRVQWARALAQDGQDRRAAEVLRDVLKDDPTWTRAHLDLGTVLTRLGDLDLAEQHLRQALELDIHTTEIILTLFQLGSIRQMQSDLPGAISFYRRAVALGPEVRDAHFNLAIALAQSGNLPEAIEHFQRLTELSPDDVSAWGLMARAQAGAGRIADAIATLRTAIERFPENPQLRQALADLEARP